MDDARLHPWMLAADWRDDRRPYAIIDLASWPADLAPEPMPPVPVIAVGDGAHPQARRADLRIADGFRIEQVARRISQAPQASATLVQLLRSIEGMPAAHALTLESFAFAMLQGGGEHAAWLAARPVRAALPPGVLHLSRIDDRLDLLIDRPAAHNAIDRAMRDALYEACTLAALDGGIASVRVRATGRIFSNGADLAEFGTTRDPVEAHAIRSRTLPARAMAPRAEIYDVHVQGGCVGSALELAAFAGRFTAAPDAWFQLPETAMGILPGAGGCVSLPRRIGRQRTTLLVLSGRRIDAARALRWGLIDAIVNDDAGDDRRPHTIGR